MLPSVFVAHFSMLLPISQCPAAKLFGSLWSPLPFTHTIGLYGSCNASWKHPGATSVASGYLHEAL